MMQLAGLTVGIIADDVTGACDTALQFHDAALSVRVISDATVHPPLPKEPVSVWALSTNTRHAEKRQVASVVRDAVRLLQERYDVDRFYKKIDSTLRGHLALECLAVLEALDWDCAVVAPAYPAEKRRTVGGYQLVDGIPVEKTEAARDPLAPVCMSHLPTLLRGTLDDPDLVGHIELVTVLRGAAPLLAALTEQVEAGKKLVVIDACSETDLEQIALAVQKMRKSKKILPCGSAGFAAALKTTWIGQTRKDELEADVESTVVPLRPSLDKAIVPVSPVLILSGSMTVLTRQQLKALRENYSHYAEDSELTVFEVSPAQILGLDSLDSLIDEIRVALGVKNTVVVSTALKEDACEKTLALAEEHAIAEDLASRKASMLLGGIAKAVSQDLPALKLVLTGGETTVQVCRQLQCEYFTLEAEVEPSIPLLREVMLSASLSGELAEATPEAQAPLVRQNYCVVTKSGNFGSELTLANVVRYLKQREGSVLEQALQS